MTVGSTIRCTVCAILITLPLLLVAAEEKAPGPKDPVSPSADFSGKEGDRQHAVRAALVKARGERLEGELFLAFTSLNLSVAGTGGAKIRTVPLAGIAAIEFVRWQGRKRRDNEYAFYPTRIRVTLADKTVIESGINTTSLYRLRLRTGGRTISLYTFFFEYREKDAWKNSGEKTMAYPETNPHADTVVRIEMLHESGTNPLDAIIKMLSK